ncbi:MAG: penicillin-binding transpeptidase domain-containing protein, partial [Lachnospiraceae bacterium]
NGEVYAMVNVPEFDLNDPYTLTDSVFRQYSVSSNEMTEGGVSANAVSEQDLLNKMWRNGCLNDTYEPGSTFKIITAAAAFEKGVVTVNDHFSCPGFIIVEDRRIKCHKVIGHGAETFLEGAKNSCNPVFISVGLRVGAESFYNYFEQFGLLKKTGIDLPGEAGTIMHKKEDIGLVELATVSFGQSFQITPIQLITTVSSLVNGGTRVTPHFGVAVYDQNEKKVKEFTYDTTEHIISKETTETLRYVLEKVVSEGTGKNAALEGYTVGGKTATSQTLPRSSNKYISSFIGFAPAEDPQVIALLIIHNPQGVYYGGTIAAPRVKELYENILPYLGIPRTKTEPTEE